MLYAARRRAGATARVRAEKRMRKTDARLGALCAALALVACESSDAQRGRQLFTGEKALFARMAGHETGLPALASRCVNCHAVEPIRGAAVSAPASGADQPFGGVLSPDRLRELRSRRGAPPSQFNRDSLCRLLRTGVDPAQVIISSSMPRYEVSDADCFSLWAYLSAGRK